MAVPLRVFFCSVVFRRICGRQPDTSLAATYLMVPHEHKSAPNGLSAAFDITSDKRWRRKSLLKAVAHQVKATDDNESRKAGSAHVLFGRERHLAVSFY